jgi:hypothetical protein
MLNFIKLTVVSAALAASLASVHAQVFLTYSLGGSNGAIGEYSPSGAPIDPTLVTGAVGGGGIAVIGSDIYVTNTTTGTVGEYTLSGQTINDTLISGLSLPYGITPLGSNLLVCDDGHQKVAEYTATGTLLNSSFLSGFSNGGIVVSGSNFFITNLTAGTVGEYTTSGAVVNPSFITGLNLPYAIALSGSHLFVSSGMFSYTIGEYDATTGATINASLITGIGQCYGIAVLGDNLLVSQNGNGVAGAAGVSEYTLSGDLVNASFISGLTGAGAIMVIPEPSAWSALLGLLSVGVVALRRLSLPADSRRSRPKAA